MSADKFDGELSTLYQQRKQQIVAPEVKLGETEQKHSSVARSPLHMLLLLLAGGAASFGVMAIVNYFAKPSVHGNMEQYKQHTVKIVEIAPRKIITSVLPTTPPLPPQPESKRPAAAKSSDHAATAVAISRPEIDLSNTLKDGLAVPVISQPKQPPIPVHKVMPEYPKSAVYARQSGMVKLAYRINSYGEVVDIISFNDRSHRVLEKSAKQALAKWKFSPEAHSNNTLEVMFEFNLDQ